MAIEDNRLLTDTALGLFRERGYEATTHWAWMDMLPLFGAKPVAKRTAVDRNRVTGGGVTAGIDFALTLMAEVRGEAHARLVQLSLEYDPQPPFDSGSPERAGEELVARYRRRADRIAPDREAKLRAAADRRDRAAPGSPGSS